MDWGQLLRSTGVCASPLLAAVLVGLATLAVWFASAPARRRGDVEQRLDELLEAGDIIEAETMRRPFARRALLPALKATLRALGGLAPRRNVEKTQQLLLQAGLSGRLTALDFYGVRLLCVFLGAAGYFALAGRALPLAQALLYSALVGVVGYFLPLLWMRMRANRRKREILRALPDALDMLTIGVEAGLAFESAMLRVGERWKNALTQEFRQAVTEMRVGTSRDDALQRVVERSGVPELATFVAVLIQSTQLGVSIAQVLHAQADQMRIRRRQRAEELARQAGIKMIFPLAILIFPALLVVILGPVIPLLIDFFASLGGSGSFTPP